MTGPNESEFEIAALIEYGEVLDEGCGEGIPTMRLAELGYTTVGLDAALTAVDAARAEAARGRGAQRAAQRPHRRGAAMLGAEVRANPTAAIPCPPGC